MAEAAEVVASMAVVVLMVAVPMVEDIQAATVAARVIPATAGVVAMAGWAEIHHRLAAPLPDVLGPRRAEEFAILRRDGIPLRDRATVSVVETPAKLPRVKRPLTKPSPTGSGTVLVASAQPHPQTLGW